MTDKFDEMAETLLPVAVFGSDETIMIARIEISKALRAQHKAGQEAMRERNEKLEAALEMIACDEKISLGHGDYDERPLDNIAMQKVARAALAALSEAKPAAQAEGE